MSTVNVDVIHALKKIGASDKDAETIAIEIDRVKTDQLATRIGQKFLMWLSGITLSLAMILIGNAMDTAREIAFLQKDASYIKTDITEMKSDIKQLKDDVSKILDIVGGRK